MWIEYAQFAIGASTLERTRSILEEGINAAGLVCSKGLLLWDTYREIEFLHISSHSEGSEEWKKQVNGDVMHNKKSNLFLEKFCVYKIVLKIFIF